jgi:hypothetical protein
LLLAILGLALVLAVPASAQTGGLSDERISKTLTAFANYSWQGLRT